MPGRSFLAVGVMARAPSTPGKTRLAAHIPEPRLSSLRSAMLADTLSVVTSIPLVDVFVFFTPDDAAPDVERLSSRGLEMIPQAAGNLGARMKAAFDRRGLRGRFPLQFAWLRLRDSHWLGHPAPGHRPHCRGSFASSGSRRTGARSGRRWWVLLDRDEGGASRSIRRDIVGN
jgi:hypothetical protein